MNSRGSKDIGIVPAHVSNDLESYCEAGRLLLKRHGRRPRDYEISERLCWTLEKVRKVRDFIEYPLGNSREDLQAQIESIWGPPHEDIADIEINSISAVFGIPKERVPVLISAIANIIKKNPPTSIEVSTDLHSSLAVYMLTMEKAQFTLHRHDQSVPTGNLFTIPFEYGGKKQLDDAVMRRFFILCVLRFIHGLSPESWATERELMDWSKGGDSVYEKMRKDVNAIFRQFFKKGIVHRDTDGYYIHTQVVVSIPANSCSSFIPTIHAISKARSKVKESSWYNLIINQRPR